MAGELLTRKQVEDLTGASRATIQRALKAGALKPQKKTHKGNLFHINEVQRWNRDERQGDLQLPASPEPVPEDKPTPSIELAELRADLKIAQHERDLIKEQLGKAEERENKLLEQLNRTTAALTHQKQQVEEQTTQNKVTALEQEKAELIAAINKPMWRKMLGL
jgi:chromosome segregation ATPase